MRHYKQEDIDAAKALISPPGDTLLETIDAKGISQVELAQRMGRPIKTINEIVKGKTAITAETAIQLEMVLGIPAEFWIEREKNYRLELAKIEEAERSTELEAWAKFFPVKEMQTFGWIEETKDMNANANNILRFFSVADEKSFHKTYYENIYEAAFRISKVNSKNPYAIAAWLRKGEIQAEELKVPDYDAKKFEGALLSIKKLMAEHPSDFFVRLQILCMEAGVKVVHTPCLPKAPISGSTRWVNGNPLIQLSGRYKRNDSFWFTFFHEAGHILLHGKKDVFIENLEYSGAKKTKEEEADDFSINWTLSEKEEKEILNASPLSREDIVAFAKKFVTHPAIIIGRFQHKKLVSHDHVFGREFMKPIQF